MNSLLHVANIGKTFSGVRVLRDVSFTLSAGEVLGVVGENGAGKSTLMNILAGVHQPDTGTLTLDGLRYLPFHPANAVCCGVALVHQELNIFPNLTVAENIFLSGFPCRRVLGLPLLDRTAMKRRAGELLKRLDLATSPDTPVERLSQGERQLVEIAKALHSGSRVIIFDEPTTSLTGVEAARLFAQIERLRAEGMAIIYISHTVPDVLRLADRLLVLRDGAAVAQREARGCTEGELISLMVGRDLGQLFPEPGAASAADIVFEVRGISQPGVLHDINFQLHKGELLGIAGLMGSGRSELARALFGLDACAEGEIRLNHSRLDGLSTRARIRKGLALLTENRRADGLLMLASCAANLTLVTPDPPAVPKVAADIRLHSADLNRQPVQQLSGGNQQKVAFGKWLLRLPQVLMLDEPTRGIDVGARQEIYRIMRNLAGQGIGLLVISSEIEELMGLCDRILVMRRGEIRATLSRAEFHRERILQEAV